MTLYSLGLFVHIVGALVMTSAQVLEKIGLTRLKQAGTSGELRSVFGFLRPLRQLYQLSGAAIVLSGVYLTIDAWGPRAWVIVSLVTVLAMAASGPLVTGRRFAQIGKHAYAGDGPLRAEVLTLTNAPVLEWSHVLRMGAMLAVVFLMVTKPALVPSL